MPDQIGQLRQAGFSDEEIGDWATGQRTQLKGAGFNDDEISQYLGGGIPAPDKPPEPFLARLMQGTALGHQIDAFGQRLSKAFGEGAAEGYGAGAPAIFSEDFEKNLRDAGVLPNPEKGYGGPLRFANEALLSAIGKPANVIGRLTGAGLGGLAGTVGEAVAEAGGPGEKAKAEIQNLGNFLMAESGSHMPFSAVRRGPMGEIHDVPLGTLPKSEDFKSAAQSIVGDQASVAFQEKLKRLYEEKGLHPAEVAHDAAGDATVTQSLASTGTDLPERYAGAEEVKEPAEGAERAPPMAPPGPPESAFELPEVVVTPTGEPSPLRPAETIAPADIPPHGITSFAPGALTVDADRFQFKSGGDEAGVTDRLQGVQTWDPVKAGLSLVWQDEGGNNFIVDGHQRLALAQRIEAADPAQQPRLNAIVLRAADGVTDADARVIAASKNIAEGTGTAVDAAKILRERPELIKELPPRSELVRQARGLAELGDEPFRMVVNEVVPPAYGALVGRLAGGDERLQAALLELLAKTEPANIVQAEAIVRQGIEAGTRTETQATLFGDQEVVSSLYKDRAQVLDRTLRQLKRDRLVFATIVRDEDVIQAVGNRLETSANANRAAADAQAVQILQVLANRRGPLSDALNAAARRAADGDRAGAVRDFVEAVRRQSESGDLVRAAAGLERGRADVGREDAARLVDPDADPGAAGAAGAANEAAARAIEEAKTARPAVAPEPAPLPTANLTQRQADRWLREHGAAVPAGLLPTAYDKPYVLNDGRVIRVVDASTSNVWGLMSGQVHLEEMPREAVTERTAQGEQLVIPGAERSALQAQAAREAEGRGRIAPTAPQEAPGGLFEEPAAEEPELKFGPETGAIAWGPAPPKTPLDLARDSILDKISIGERPTGRTLRRTLDGLIRDWVEQFYPIQQITPRGLPTAVNPYRLARMMAGLGDRITFTLRRGTLDFATLQPNGIGLEQVLAPVKDDLDGFRAFAVAAHALEVEAEGLTSGIDTGAARTYLRQTVGQYGAVLEQLVAYQNRVAAYMRDAGVISSDAYDAMTQRWQLYIPFNRVLGDGDGYFGAGSSLQASNPLNRFKGSLRDIVDPLENVIRNTATYMTMAEKNAATTSLRDLLAAGGQIGARPGAAIALVPHVADPALDAALDQWLQAHGVPPPPAGMLNFFRAAGAQPLDRGEIAVFDSGVRHVYKVDPELAEAWKGLDHQTAGFLEKLLTPMSRSLRAGAVLSPEFGVRHPYRDFFYAAVTGGFTPFDMARGYAGMVAHYLDDRLGIGGRLSDEYWNWMKSGGGNNSMVALDRRFLQEDLEKLTQQTGLMTRTWNLVADPNATWLDRAGAIAGLPFSAVSRYVLRPFQAFTAIAENATHLGKYIQVERAMTAAQPGVPLSREQILEAGWQSRDIAIDASQIGAKMKALNMISAFSNIVVRDSARWMRAFREDPVSTSIKTAAYLTIPQMLLYLAQRNDPRYDEIPAWQRVLTVPILTDKWEDVGPAGQYGPPDPKSNYRVQDGRLQVNNGTIFRLPQPWSLGVIFGAGPVAVLRAFQQHSGRPLTDWLRGLADVSMVRFMPNAVTPFIEQYANRSTFTDRTLIPSQLEHQLPEYQYTPYTTEAAKALGQLFGAFPGMEKTAVEPGRLGGGVARALTSPILIENYIRGWTGGLGVYALQIADYALRKQGILPDPPKPASTLADIPVVKAFVIRYPTASAQSIQDFYDAYQVNKTYYDTWQAQAKEGNAAAAQQIMTAGGPGIFVQLDQMHKTLTEHSQLIRDVYKDPQMRPEEKRQLIDQIYFRMIEVGQAGKQMMRQVNEMGGVR